ncbi:hypothetical protein F5B20DRAFT_79395 [Whalleya microplaca]|nr:hypothetical protein F5B20DRAFT_79395 [Whalleya microplaca]
MATTPAPLPIASLLGSDDYSDLTLACEGQEFKAHKAIVCTQSPVLAAALRGDFEEARTNLVNINFDLVTCKQMINFLYTGQYEVSSSEEPGRPRDKKLNVEGLAVIDDNGWFSSPYIKAIVFDSYVIDSPTTLTADTEAYELVSEQQNTSERLLSHVRVNAIADYYAVTALCQLANSKICEIIQTEWSPIVFTNVVKEALNSTGDDSFYEMMARLAAEHIAELMEIDTFVKLELPSNFAMGLLQNCSKRLEEAKNEIQKAKMAKADADFLRLEFETRNKENELRLNYVNECFENLNDIDQCRNSNCSTEFPFYIESNCILRCSKCRCRHSLDKRGRFR